MLTKRDRTRLERKHSSRRARGFRPGCERVEARTLLAATLLGDLNDYDRGTSLNTVGDQVLFTHIQDDGSTALFATNPGAAGVTRLLSTPTVSGSAPINEFSAVRAGTNLFFEVTTPELGTELWASACDTAIFLDPAPCAGASRQRSKQSV